MKATATFVLTYADMSKDYREVEFEYKELSYGIKDTLFIYAWKNVDKALDGFVCTTDVLQTVHLTFIEVDDGSEMKLRICP